MDWASLIRRVRRHRLMTQAELAAALNVSQGTVSRWEAGQFEPELRYQTMLRDFLRANRPELETRMVQSVWRALGNVCLMESDGTIVAASPKMRKLLEFEAEPDNPSAVPLERRSPGARKVLTREDSAAWMFEVASISFLSGVVTPSGQRVAMRQLWTPFLLEGARTVIRKEVEPLAGQIHDDSLFQEDPPIEVTFLDELV